MADIISAICLVIFVFLGIATFIYCCKDNAKKEVKTVLKTILLIVFIIGVISTIVFFSENSSDNKRMKDYDNAMAGYDWGSHSYYNSQNHRVEYTPFKE